MQTHNKNPRQEDTHAHWAMDIIFEPQGGRPFTIEVGFFDTVLEIKEKVQKYQGVPVAKQTLLFNGKILHDDLNVERCEILHNSHVHLLISPPDTDEPQTKIEEPSTQAPPPPPPPTSKKIQLMSINIPSILEKKVTLEMDPNDNVLRLKEKIHEMDPPLAANKLVLQSNGGDFQEDHRSLRECELADNNEVNNVNVQPSPTSSGSVGSTGGSKKLKVMVLPKCGTNKIPLEVNAWDKVGELRNELHNLQDKLQFHLPSEGYFFIYKQNVMDDDRSFKWHNVGHGDTIEIFNGRVTGGS